MSKTCIPTLMNETPVVILGIDPGTTRIGFGVIEKRGRECKHFASGLLPIKESSLLETERGIQALLIRHNPSKVGVEKLFFTKNKKTALQVSEHRGVIVSTLLKHGITPFEFTPSEIKKAVTDNGNADKAAVAKMVKWTLHLDEVSSIDDVTDALAIAITTAYRQDF